MKWPFIREKHQADFSIVANRKVRELLELKDVHVNAKTAIISDYYVTTFWYRQDVLVVCCVQ
jgi:hypothetical protein